MKIVVGVLYSLLPEIVVFAIAALLAAQVSTFPAAGRLAVEISAAAILVAALGLSVQFNRSRISFGLLTLIGAYLASFALSRLDDPVKRAILDGGLCLMLPLDVLIFAFIPERGVFSRYGGLWFGVLAGETLALWALTAFHSPLVAHALQVQFTQMKLLTHIDVSQPALLLIGLGLLCFNDRLLWRHDAESAAFFLAMVCVLPVLHGSELARSALFLGAAGLGFGYAVIQGSWSMAYLDELTGLPGRRALEEQMRQLGGRYVIAMVDVDHFKHFNDRYGHDVGDQVLRFVASRLQRPALLGKPFRYGGEEFCLLYSNRDLSQVKDELEQVRADIESCRFDLRQGGRRNEDTGPGDPHTDMLSITVSIGAAQHGEHLDEPWTVLKAADKALYDAKHAGRNRVSLGGV
ncbi:MAG TPA: diguanylate cyclase [Gammaproteobacteria bacterium]|jgi:diguanylate cyclase (GGDEF)-like protein